MILQQTSLMKDPKHEFYLGIHRSHRYLLIINQMKVKTVLGEMTHMILVGACFY